MITIHGKKFAKNNTEAVESLFDSTGTVSGYCKVSKRKILFMNLQMEPIAFINQHGVLGNAFVFNETIRYQAGMPSDHILYSGSMMTDHNEVEKLAKGRDKLGFYFT
jgi:hypothetical protein